MLAYKPQQLFREHTLDLFMIRAFDGLRVGIRGVNHKATARFALDMEGELQFAATLGGQLQPGKLVGQASEDGLLNLALQFLAGWRLEGRDRRIRRTRNEPALGLGLDPVGEFGNELFQFHSVLCLPDCASGRDCSPIPARYLGYVGTV